MKRNFFGITISVLITAIFFINCSKGSSSSSSGGSYSTPPAGGTGTTPTNAVTLANMSFGPVSLTVKVGTTITWTNNDSYTHTVTADDNSFDSGDLITHAVYTHTFSAAGTYNYHCKYHSMMLAKVIVQ